MTILFLTTVLPGDRRTGGEVVSQAFIGALRDAGHGVAVLGYARPGVQSARHRDDFCAGTRPIETSEAGLRVAGWWVGSVVRRLPYSAAKYVSRKYRNAAADLFAELAPELVIVDHAQSAWSLPRDAAPVPWVYLAYNVERDLYLDQAHRGPLPRRAIYAREARLAGELEANLAKGANEVWALTDDDASALRALGSSSVRSFDVPAGWTPNAPGEPEIDVALLGTWSWAPNSAGLRWFLEAVVPRLPDGMSVEVGGAGAEGLTRATPRVAAANVVPHAQAFLQRARVVAVPAVAGAGVQVKTLDAIATGRRVVATPLAMRGLGAPPSTVRIAGEPAAFAAAVTEAAMKPPRAVEQRSALAWIERRAQAFGNAVEAAAWELAGRGV